MGSHLGIGAGAGFVSALLFAVTTTGNPLSIILYFVAPLPLLIAGLGWSHRAALIGALAGGLILGLAFTPLAGAVYLGAVALPAWWFGYLLMLSRGDEGATQWYPPGRLLLWIALLCAGLTVAGALFLSGDYQAFSEAFERAIVAINEANPQLLSGLGGEDRDRSVRDFASLMVLLAPPISAAAGVVIDVALIWAAARVCKASDRLARPWPAIASTAMPMSALAVLVVSVLGSFMFDQFVGLAARSCAAAMLMAFGLQGLASLHALTVGLSGRGGILAGVYAVLVLIPGWPVLALALLGVADAIFGLRARRAAALPPPRSST
jgi:hypothetical protein